MKPNINLWCDGSNGEQGVYAEHPRVYFSDEAKRVQCPYCGKQLKQEITYLDGQQS